MKIYYIYKLTCLTTGLSYIGQTKNQILRRIKAHIEANSLIGEIIREFGIKNFKIKLLWEAISQEEADIVEKAAIFTHNTKIPNGYNIMPGGHINSPWQGKKNPEHSKRMQGNKYGQGGKGKKKPKLSQVLKGKKCPHISERNKNSKGQKRSEKGRLNIAIANLKKRLNKLLEGD